MSFQCLASWQSDTQGETYNTKRNMWEAKYQAGDKSQISLGLFKDDTKAAKEYDRAMVSKAIYRIEPLSLLVFLYTNV